MALARLTVAVALLLAGCGLDGTPLGTRPDDADRSVSVPDDAPDDEQGADGETPAEAADGSAGSAGSAALGSPAPVRRALRRLFTVDTGRVVATVYAGGGQVVDEATYDLRRGYEFRRRFVHDGEELQIEGLMLGRDLWFRLLVPRSTECWAHTTPDVLDSFSTETAAWTAAARRPMLPSGLVVASTFRAVGPPDATGFHPGTTRLVGVLGLLGRHTLNAAGLSQRDRARVAAEARIVDGDLLTIAVDGHHLAAALDDADVELPGTDASTMRSLVSFSLPGTEVDLVPPPLERTVDLTDDQDRFKAEMRACERAARGSPGTAG